jgi:hypothetical protein
MVVTTKHSLEEAARFSGLHKSLFSKMLHSHSKVAIATLESLSKTQARQFSKVLQRVNGLPWKIVIIIDSTLQHRASLHPENAKTFNHGKGYVIGHQWTNIVLVLGDMLIPLRPIPFYSKRYCQTHALKYQSEHERVVEYLRTLDLEDYLGSYDRRESWCWPIAVMTTKRSRRPLPPKAGTSLLPWGQPAVSNRKRSI